MIDEHNFKDQALVLSISELHSQQIIFKQRSTYLSRHV